MKRHGLLYLVLTGTVMLGTGVGITMTLLVRRGDCSGVTPLAACEGYAGPVRWAIAFLVVGASCFVAAGLLTVRVMVKEGRRSVSSGLLTGESTD